MNKKLVLASAGAGKTHRIVEESIKQINSDKKILVVTYTENNQKEIYNKFKDLKGENRENFHVKGLFTFLLEELIRPYQNCIFTDRIQSINFNNYNPHKIGKMTIKGRQEKHEDGSYNFRCYLTKDKQKAHTMFLAKLATRVIQESDGKTIERLGEIYNHIYFDEVQDLVGWDYDLISAIAKSNKVNITCVGDFRQTIYETSTASKQPKTNQQKIDRFEKMGFKSETMSISRRSIQSICDFADTINGTEYYDRTESLVKDIPLQFNDHTGVYIVKKSDVTSYIEKFKPTLLRWGISSGKFLNQYSIEKVNFGKSKGLGFNRVLVFPTPDYAKYLMGNSKVFDGNKSDEKRNKLYVAATRGRYSLCFIIDDDKADDCNLPVWK